MTDAVSQEGTIASATTPGEGEPHVGSPSPASSSGGGWQRLAGIAVIVAIVGLALGRFVLFAPENTDSVAVDRSTPADTVATLERMTADDPDDISGWQRLGIAYTQRAAETGDPAFYDLANRAFLRADAIEPDAFVTLVGRGALALSLHEFADAEALGERADALAPRNVDVLGILVDARVELGAYDEAADTLQQMLDRNPALPALARTSYLRELNGDLRGAAQAMQQAIAAGGVTSAYDLALVEALLGDIQLRRGDLQAASASFDRATELLPSLIEASLGRARLAAARGDVARGIAILAPVVARIPRPDAVILYADLLRLDGQEDAAEEADDLTRTLTALQASGGQDVDLELALFEADRGDDAGRALALAQQAHERRPDNVFAADTLAWALHRAGRTEDALPLVADALRLGTAIPLLHAHAVLIADAAGDDALVRVQLEPLLAMTPWTMPAHREAIIAVAEANGVAVPASWSMP